MSRGVRSSRPHRHGNAQITQQQALAIVRTEPRSAHAKIARSDEALAAQARESAADIQGSQGSRGRHSRHRARFQLICADRASRAPPASFRRPICESATILLGTAAPESNSLVLPRRVNPVYLSAGCIVQQHWSPWHGPIPSCRRSTAAPPADVSDSTFHCIAM